MTRRRLLTFLAIWVAVSAMLLAASADPALPVVGGIIASLSAGVLVVADSDWLTGQRVWSVRRSPSRASTATDGRGSELRRQIRAASHTDSAALHARLVELVDDALLDRHDVDRVSDPSSAEPMLSPALRRLVGGPSRRLGSVHELHRIIDDIEEL